MKKEPNFLLSPTLGNLYVFSNNLSRLLPIFTVLQRGDERQKYGVIEDSNKKAERLYSPGNTLYMCSSFDNNPEIFVRKEIYAPKLFIVRVRTVLLWRRRRDSNPRDVSIKRFSRPPRYDRFDTPPRLCRRIAPNTLCVSPTFRRVYYTFYS